MSEASDEQPPGRPWWQGRGRWLAPAAAVVVAGVIAGTVTLVSGSGSNDGKGGAPSAGTEIQVSLGTCGQGWSSPHGGTQVFAMHNTMDRPAEVHLVDARSGAVYGEVEGLAPGTTRPMSARLGAGTYRFRCLPDDAAAVTGPVVHIGGTAHDSNPAAVPVDQHELIPPTLDYQKWIGGRMADLDDATGALRSTVRSGDLAAARTAWLKAHLVYERMGAAYGTFGDADGAINGTDAGLPDGVKDPGFTGFHRLEQGLWHGESAASLRPVADRLAKDVHALRDSWASERMDPADLGLRAHEILENTLQFELTGRTDYGSGTNLATARANLDGTRAVLSRLHPLLRTRYPHLDQLDASLAHLQKVLDAQHRGGSWTPLKDLSRTDREQINAAAGDALERLADIAAICDVRRTA
ncbi:EfeM/EfeO family lipoprotein [Streptomyces sp. TS71-3]|uniref:EfeM/EfeO family lipoprotein n=1 Tax=Streptomyces sp. TS71-3 TaxID=2733862 RepID=UPI001B17FFF5|nr:EfeM/EfeO family lipoprotein [Streptomyces sp. TS71-3]GHJ40724.1 iron transporter [Streptomyces sp. TS71-3]